MILGDGQREDLLTVHEAHERELGAGEIFLDHDLALAEFVVKEHILQSHLGVGEGLRDDDSLAGGQPVIFQDNREGVSADIFNGIIVVVEGLEGGGRNVVLLHQPFREILAGLDAGGCGGRSEYPQSSLFEGIGDSGGERDFRPHNRQVNTVFLREVHKFRDLCLLERNALGLGGDPGVPRSAEYLADTSGAAQSVHNGVLAATATDNQHVLGQQSVQHYGLAVTLVR